MRIRNLVAWVRSRGVAAQVLAPVALVMLVTTGAVLSQVWSATRDNAVAGSLTSARNNLEQFKLLRAYYTNNVVKKVQAGSGVRVSHDHKESGNTIPLPATFIHELGEEISRQEGGVKLRLYSEYPFPNRGARALDPFARDALAYFRANPQAETFSRVEEVNGEETVRTAVADRMTSPTCVACHNQHPASPKTDWQVGDTRGVLEADVPIGDTLRRSARLAQLISAVVGGGSLLILGVIALILWPVRRDLGKTVRVLDAVGRGDLTQRVDVARGDEVGRLAAALNAAIGNMEANVTEMARVQSMTEQAPINLMFADRDLVIRYANPASVEALKTLGHLLPVAAGGVVGQPIDVFYQKPEHHRRLLADPRNLPHRESIAVGPETLDMLVSPIYDRHRNYLGAMVTWEVVTQKLAAERQVKETAEREAARAERLQRDVGAIQVVVGALAAGDFTRRVPDLGDDVVGQMAFSLNQAVGTVRAALEGVREVSDQLADASAQLAAASDEISAGAQEQASSLEETASTLEEITATVRQNSDAAQQARQLASGSKDVAEKGGQVVGSAVGAMGEINQSSKKIADIITTIDEIAFQTNLLALNAAVEAARAGEQGRGFAVVAAEVRNLAQRSATAAKEIKGLIQDSVKKVGVGTDLVNRSGSTLDEIVTSVKRVTDIVTEIAAASREQSTGIDQVNKAVTQMDAVTQRNAGQTEELSATAQTLTEQADQLRDLVARFKLSETAGPAGGPNTGHQLRRQPVRARAAGRR